MRDQIESNFNKKTSQQSGNVTADESMPIFNIQKTKNGHPLVTYTS